MTDVPVYLSPKRKRGRPRKDGNLYREHSFKKLSNPTFRKTLNAYKDDNNTAEGMVGRTVYGVIEGSFDAGYLISVRTSNNCTPFRGVVFQSEKVVPVTPANDVAPNAKMYGRREIPVPAYNLQSQFNDINPVSPCRPQTAIAPYLLTSHSTFSVTEPTVSKIGSCFNVGGNIITLHENPRPVVNNMPSSACPIENLGIIEQDELMFGFNMNNMVKTGDVVSESSFESMFNSFLGNGVKSDLSSSVLMQNKLHGSNVELHHHSGPQSEFETQQNAAVGNQCLWQREPQVIKSELELTNIYHSETNNLDINFHQNLFTYQSQHGSQEQPKRPESKFHQVHFNEGDSMSPNLKLNLASVIQEKKSLQEPESSNARVETKYLVPFLQSPENETNLALKSVLETGERFHDEDVVSLVEAGAPGSGLKEESLFKLELATVQSTPERRRVKPTDNIMEMDYVLSDVVPFAESQDHLWETKYT